MNRALLTETERRVLALGVTPGNDVSKNHYQNARYRYRQRLDELRRDIELLTEHDPELARELFDEIRDLDEGPETVQQQLFG